MFNVDIRHYNSIKIACYVPFNEQILEQDKSAHLTWQDTDQLYEKNLKVDQILTG